jgi:hypothetical protein
LRLKKWRFSFVLGTFSHYFWCTLYKKKQQTPTQKPQISQNPLLKPRVNPYPKTKKELPENSEKLTQLLAIIHKKSKSPFKPFALFHVFAQFRLGARKKIPGLKRIFCFRCFCSSIGIMVW